MEVRIFGKIVKKLLYSFSSGTNGLYEAIYHGVPILGLPIVVDQFDNMQRITGRGAGRTLDISNLTEDKLYENIMK